MVVFLFLKFFNGFGFLARLLSCAPSIAANGPRHSPAVPAVMQVLEALLLVWRAGAVGGLFSHRLSYAHGRASYLYSATFQFCNFDYLTISVFQCDPSILPSVSL